MEKPNAEESSTEKRLFDRLAVLDERNYQTTRRIDILLTTIAGAGVYTTIELTRYAIENSWSDERDKLLHAGYSFCACIVSNVYFIYVSAAFNLGRKNRLIAYLREGVSRERYMEALAYKFSERRLLVTGLVLSLNLGLILNGVMDLFHFLKPHM